MATIERFEDLKVWQKARALCKEVHIIINKDPFAKDFSLRNQINASSGSIMDNIAEGFDRSGRKEFIQFLSFAKGSNGEVKSQLYRALDKGYITNEIFNTNYKLADEIGKMIGSFIQYLKKSTYSGSKFNEPEVPYLINSKLATSNS